MSTRTGPRTTRSLSPLTETDLPEIRRQLGGTRHNTARLDHEDPRPSCDGCAHAAYYTALALAAKARTRRWGREEALSYISVSGTRARTLAKDGERMRRADTGAATRPDVAATAKYFTRAFDRAWATGQLSQRPEVAEEVLRWAITFAGDPGERLSHGRTLPFERMARTVIGGPATDQLTDEEVMTGWASISPPGTPDLAPEVHVERLWAEIERACSRSADAAEALDRLVTSRSDRLSTHTTLWKRGAGGLGEQPLDDLVELRSIWVVYDALGTPAVEWHAPGARDAAPSPLVEAAAAQLASDKRPWRDWVPEDRERLAAQTVIDLLVAEHGPVDAGVAEFPEVVELAHEVLAEASLRLSA